MLRVLFPCCQQLRSLQLNVKRPYLFDRIAGGFVELFQCPGTDTERIVANYVEDGLC